MLEENEQKTFKPIDIREIIKGKSPSVARLLPGFVYRFIHRVMRIDFINGFLERNGHLTGIDFVNAVVRDFEVTEKVYGAENIPPSGRFIFAGNHPLGGFDSMLLMENVYTRLGDFKFLVNDVLMNIPHLEPLFVPVNKHGKNDREAALALQQAYASDLQILIFPSGYASRKIKGEVVDLEWRKHFISKSIEYKRDVIPVFFGGKNSNRFYRIANLRKFFRIKWNLEMFLLPDETYRHRKKEVQIYFGKPISYTTFDKSKTQQQWADYVREKVYQLPQTNPSEN